MSGPMQHTTRRHSFMPNAASAQDSAAPPAYSSGRGQRSARRHSQQTLPDYSCATALEFPRRNDPQAQHGGQTEEHEFHLLSSSDNDSRPWLTMRLFTRPSKVSQRTPRYFGGDNVAGTIDLDLEKGQTINSITVSLRGQFITGALAAGNFTFLNHTVTVWDKNVGDPRSVRPTALDISSRKAKFNAKLQGQYSWPFSFPFPTEICLPQKGGNRNHVFVQAPQTFLERNVRANIQYHLVVQVTHGLFRSNSKLMECIVYTPSVTPPPPSVLRQQSYLNGGFLLPPTEDPKGWHTFPEQALCAEAGGTSIPISCAFSLATPLSYTRGTVVPCFIKLATSSPAPFDLDSLLLHAKDSSLQLILYRKMIHLLDSSQASILPPSLRDDVAGAASLVQEVAKAVWWRPPTHNGRPLPSNRACVLEGEIHLADDLQPSCQAGFLSIEYFARLAAPLKGSSSRARITSSATLAPVEMDGMRAVSDAIYPVQVATFHLNGPLPTPFTPSSTRSRSHGTKSKTHSPSQSSETNESHVIFQGMAGLPNSPFQMQSAFTTFH